MSDKLRRRHESERVDMVIAGVFTGVLLGLLLSDAQLKVVLLFIAGALLYVAVLGKAKLPLMARLLLRVEWTLRGVAAGAIVSARAGRGADHTLP